jgi:hypothetical protein
MSSLFSEEQSQEEPSDAKKSEYDVQDTNMALPEGSAEIGVPPIQSMSGAVTALVDTEDLLNDIELNLRGQILSKKPDGSLFYGKIREPIMNTRGIAAFMSPLRSACNKNTTMSVTPSWRIPIIVGTTGILIFKTIAINKNAYDLNDDDFAEMPMRIISSMSVLEMSYRAGTEGRQQTNVFTTQKNMHITQDTNTPVQKGLLQRMYDGLRGNSQ